MRKLFILILSLATFALSAAVAMGGDDPDQPMVDEVLQTLLPNATGELGDDSSFDGARRLTIRLAETVPALGPESTSADFAHQAQMAWLSELAGGGAIARSRRIGAFAVVDGTGRLLPDGAGWGARLRVDPQSDPWAIYRKLGTVAPEDAQTQIDSNLAVLRSGAGSDLLRAAEARIVPIGRARNTYGVAVELRVSSLRSFEPYLGDAILGLSTGLVGGADTVIEGFAVRIRDDEGTEAGGWSSTRTGHGSLVGTPCQLRITMSFTSRTGGADKPVGSGSSCGAGLAVLGPPVKLANRTHSRRLTAVGGADCLTRRCVKTWPRLANKCLAAPRGTRLTTTLRKRATSVLVEAHSRSAVRRGSAEWSKARFAKPDGSGERWTWRATGRSAAIIRMTVAYADGSSAVYFASIRPRGC